MPQTREEVEKIKLDLKLQKKLKEDFNYNPESGEFTCANNSRGRIKGKLAGIVVAGHRRVSFGGKPRTVGSLTMLYQTGVLPKFVGYFDNNPLNLKESNIYSSEDRVVMRKGWQHPVKTNQEKKLDIIDAIDRFNHTEKSIISATTLSTKHVKLCLKQLMRGGQILIDRTGAEDKYTLTAKGHCRVLTKEHEIAYKKRQLFIKFYKLMPNNILPLNYSFRGHVDWNW